MTSEEMFLRDLFESFRECNPDESDTYDNVMRDEKSKKEGFAFAHAMLKKGWTKV